MWLDYVIIKLSETKTTKGEFNKGELRESSCNHRGVREGVEVSKRLKHDYGGGGGELALSWHKWIAFFTKS